MKKIFIGFTVGLGILLYAGSGVMAATIDVVQWATPYFVGDDSQKANWPYYRYANDDWGWTHGAIGGVTSSNTADLYISAFDVDYDGQLPTYTGERDEIFIYNLTSGLWDSLGFLGGSNNTWSYTVFSINTNVYADEIVAGLQVWMDIDSTNQTWAVALAKSVLSIDGAPVPGPEPIPEPATMLLLGTGLVGVAGAVRRRRNKV